MRCRLAGSVLLLVLLAGCREQAPPAPVSAEEPLRQLDEMSVQQQRVFLKGFAGDWRSDTARARGEAEPAAALPIPEGASIIDLPGPRATAVRVDRAIADRRSVREFADGALALERLSFLLLATQGVTKTERDKAGEVTRQLRAAPSGGGRYPLETFLVVQRVERLEPGLYRYLPDGHRLLLVRGDPEIGTSLQQACYDNATVGAAPVTFTWAAVPARTEWKYGPISHKMIAMEAGHVCQNLYLAAEAAGVGTCAMLGYHQPALDSLLGVDGQEVFAVYLAPVGVPAQ